MSEKKFCVSAAVYASTATRVVADSPEQALEKGMDALVMPSLCHQCSDKIELGDVYNFVVSDEDGNIVLDENEDSALQAAHTKTLEVLRDLLKENKTAEAFELIEDALSDDEDEDEDDDDDDEE